MIEADAYEVVVPPELASRWGSLPVRESRLLTRRLERAARSAYSHPVAWPVGAPGIHRGRCRAIAGELWVLYQIDAERRTLSLIGFGRTMRDELPL